MWLKLSKLSPNIGRTRSDMLHQPQRNVTIPDIKIENSIVKLESVDDFNFLGPTLNNHLRWDPHI